MGQLYTVKLAIHFTRKQQPQGGIIVSKLSRTLVIKYDCQSMPVYPISKHGRTGLKGGHSENIH